MTSEPSDPRVHRETLFWIDCSVCGPDGPLPAPRFTSEDELWSALLRPSERDWIRRDDGRILCPTHRRIAACDESGHTLSAWTVHPLDDELQWRFCLRCGSEFAQRPTP